MRWRLQEGESTLHEVRLLKIEDDTYTFDVNGEEIVLRQPRVYPFCLETKELRLALESWSLDLWRGVAHSKTFQVQSLGFGEASESQKNTIKSQMPGRVLKVLVKDGDSVATGTTLLIIEAMKMENEIKASAAGTIKTVCVKEGQSVESGELLVQLD